MSTIWRCPSSIFLATKASPCLQGVLNDGFGETVLACDICMPEPCKFPSLDGRTGHESFRNLYRIRTAWVCLFVCSFVACTCWLSQLGILELFQIEILGLSRLETSGLSKLGKVELSQLEILRWFKRNFRLIPNRNFRLVPFRKFRTVPNIYFLRAVLTRLLGYS